MKLQDFDYRLWNKEAKTYLKQKVEFEKGKVSFIPENDDSIEIELWCGLKDCKGNKIFEGDIIENIELGTKYRVDFYQGKFLLLPLKYEGKTSLQREMAIRVCVLMSEAMDKNSVFLKIIGNIHENAELLMREVGE